MYSHPKVIRQLCGALLSLGIVASSAMAAPATLTTTAIGTGYHSTYFGGGEWGPLPQGSDYTVTSIFEYDTSSVESQFYGDAVWGNARFTLSGGGHTYEYYSSPYSDSFIGASIYHSVSPDGLNNALTLNMTLYQDGSSLRYRLVQEISWRDDTPSILDVLKNPLSLEMSDDYQMHTFLAVDWSGEQGGSVDISVREGSLNVSLVPEPSEFGMLLTGLGVGALAVRRRRGAKRRDA